MPWTEEERARDRHENQIKWQRDMRQIEADRKGAGKVFGQIQALEFVLNRTPRSKLEYEEMSLVDWYFYAEELRRQLASRREAPTPQTQRIAMPDRAEQNFEPPASQRTP